MFFIVSWLIIRCVRVCLLSFRGCECICGHDKSAPTVGVRSVYSGYLQRIRLVLVCDITSNILRNVLRTFHEWLVSIPLGVGADLSRPYMSFIGSWAIIRCVRVCLLLFRSCECICGHDKSAYTAGVRSVYSWYRSAILHRIFYEMCCVHSTNGWCTFR